MNDITIVMVTYNGLEDTKNCLETLEKTTYAHDLIVIDNGSDVYTKMYLKEKCDNVIYLHKNIGVFAAMAIAMREVKTKYVCYIHQDMTFPNPDWLKDHMAIYKDGHMLMVNQYYSGREVRKRSVVCGFLLYSFIMTMNTYNACPVDWGYNLYMGDLEHQYRFARQYGKNKWSLSDATPTEHRGGVIVRERGKEVAHRIHREDLERFKKLYPDAPSQGQMMETVLMGRYIEILPLPFKIKEWMEI